jgi:hypothetical protein
VAHDLQAVLAGVQRLAAQDRAELMLAFRRKPVSATWIARQSCSTQSFPSTKMPVPRT